MSPEGDSPLVVFSVEKKEVNPIIVIAIIAVLVIFAGFGVYKASSPPAPPAGSYTPGVPPWLDKNHPAQSGVNGAPAAQPAAPPR